MASIRTHNNRRRSKARSPRQRQRDLAATYVRQYRRVYGGLRKWLNGKMFHGGGTVTGRVPRDPEPQYFLPRHGLNLHEAVMPMTAMIDYGDVERRVLAHTIQGRSRRYPEVSTVIVDAPTEEDIYETLAKKLKMPKVDVKDNMLGFLYGMSPEKAAQNKVKKNG